MISKKILLYILAVCVSFFIIFLCLFYSFNNLQAKKVYLSYKATIKPYSIPDISYEKKISKITATNPSEKLESAWKAITSIQSDEGRSVAFFANDKGLLVTTNHLLENNNAAKNKNLSVFFNNRWRNASVIKSEPAWDLAIIQAEASNTPYLSFGDSFNLALNEHLFLFDILSPKQPFLRSASIKNIGKPLDGISTLELKIALQLGNSGTPVLNSEGKVVGIIQSIDTLFPNIAYAIASNYLFDGKDSMFKEFLPIKNLSKKFLDNQVNALSKIGITGTMKNMQCLDQVFITEEKELVIIVYISNNLAEENLVADIKIENNTFQSTKKISINAVRKRLFDNALSVGSSLNKTISLSNEEYNKIKQFKEAKIDIDIKAINFNKSYSLYLD